MASQSLLALSFQTGATQSPTFRAGVEYVDVDAVVTDAEGRAVTGLTKDDFEVIEDGARQSIATFSAMSRALDPGPRLPAVVPFEPDVQSNETNFDGSVYVMVLDDLHVDALRSQNVKQAARQFIERHLGAGDRMAVLYTGRDDASQEFTSSRRLLATAVDQFLGRQLRSPTMTTRDVEHAQVNIPTSGFSNAPSADPSRDEYEAELAKNAESMLSTLNQVGQWLDGVRGRRKAVLLFSEGLNYDLTDLLGDLYVNGRARSTDSLRDTLAAMTRSNLAIYGIDPRALSADGGDAIEVSGFSNSPASLSSLRTELRLSQGSLRQLSEDTGGFATVNTNDMTSAFERIVRDNSSYYVLGYYPSSPRSDGKLHRIEVRTARPGLTVRARRGYIAPKATQSATTSRAAVNTSGAGELATALNSPLPVSGLTMRLFAGALKGSKKNASVVVDLELLGHDLSVGSNSKIDVSFVATDRQQKVRSSRGDSLPLNLDQDSKARLERGGALRLINRIDLPPGRYRLRAAARDQQRQAVGSVLADVEVPDFFKEQLSMSGVMVTSRAGSNMVTAVADERLRTVLPSPVIALRAFPSSDTLELFAEIYENSGKSRHKIDVTTTVLGKDGQPIAQSVQTHDSSEISGDRKALPYKENVPLSKLPAGDYVLRVEAKSSLASNTTVSRHVPFRVNP